jgi:UbiD family decarboxylase
MTRLRSLREFVDAPTAIGDIQPIDTEVDWDLEIGAIIRRGYDLRAAAPLFPTITHIAQRVLANWSTYGYPSAKYPEPRRDPH